MEQVLRHSEIGSSIAPRVYGYTHVEKESLIRKFGTWCEKQEPRRFLWMALTFLGQIGLALPCTLFFILNFGGNNFSLWILTCMVNVPVFALTLAAQPTKIVLPLLFLAWIAEAIIMISCLGVSLIA